MKMVKVDWESPDGNIKKYIIRRGNWGLKPTENCLCSIIITECSLVEIEKYASCISSVTIGSGDSNFERLLDQCLITMHKKEISKIVLKLQNIESSLILELADIKSNGLIYEWGAKQKYDMALKHKERGIELFNESRHVDASHRFGKALKILCSIPVEVDVPPVEIDGVKIDEMQKLRTILYNNLASCYLKYCDYEVVMKLCQKVFEKDKDNVKAFYKQGIAMCETHDYDGSQKSFIRVLELEPDNRAASDKLKLVNVKIAESNARVNTIIKKMFQT